MWDIDAQLAHVDVVVALEFRVKPDEELMGVRVGWSQNAQGQNTHNIRAEAIGGRM